MAEGSKKALVPWVTAGVLAVGAAGLATWAVPAFQEGQQLQDGATSHYSSPAAPEPTASASQESQPIDKQALTRRLDALTNDYSSGSVTLLVSDQASGEVLYDRGGDDPRVPASNFKLLTDYTLMRVSNPTDRYTTSIVGDDKTLTLVAGGDSLLSVGESDPALTVGHAGLKTLTSQTVDALVAQGASGEYALNLDTSIFAGDSLNPAWAQEDINAGFVTAVRPLAFYSHYSPGEDGKSTQSRPQDAAVQVQQRAVDQLNALGKEHDLSFTLGTEKKAGKSASPLASVESATVAEQAAYMMQESDNMLAETLARNAAIAGGQEGNIAGAKSTILSTLEKDGVPSDKLVISDFSGLSLDNRITNRTLLDLDRRIVSGENGTDAALAGFPVAGGTGTLAERFDDESEQAAQGYARAKTGTLNSVIAMTGYTTSESGHLLLFSIVANDVEDATAAKNLLDSAVASITKS